MFSCSCSFLFSLVVHPAVDDDDDGEDGGAAGVSTAQPALLLSCSCVLCLAFCVVFLLLLFPVF